MKIRFPRLFNRSLSPYKRIYYYSKDKISRSIRLELVVTFAICLCAAFIVGSWYDSYNREKHLIAEVDYSNGIEKIYKEFSYVKYEVENRSIGIKSSGDILKIISEAEKINSDNSTVKLYLTDLNGKVLYKSKGVNEESVNIFELIRKASDFKKEKDSKLVISKDNETIVTRVELKDTKEYVEIDGISFTDSKAYLIVTGIPQGRTVYIRPPAGSFLSILQGIVVFIFLFYFITNKKMRYIETVSEGLFQISKGNLKHRVKIQGKDELAELAENINQMADELKERIEAERKAEKTKNDLITNVSHDLRTPLTSIKGYLALIKDKKYKGTVELEEYLNIAYNKSEKLEVLINDLFEYTKLSNKGIRIKKEKISINELLEQLVEELYVICEENKVCIITDIPQKIVLANVDGDKLARVFENLLVNAIRYTIKPGKITLRLYDHGQFFIVEVENRCKDINKDDLERIFDRFYKLDKARSECTEGSGLGLAIAKSIVELHDGKIYAELREDNINFCVRINK